MHRILDQFNCVGAVSTVRDAVAVDDWPKSWSTEICRALSKTEPPYQYWFAWCFSGVLFCACEIPENISLDGMDCGFEQPAGSYSMVYALDGKFDGSIILLSNHDWMIR